jgi:hypothetical protein
MSTEDAQGTVARFIQAIVEERLLAKMNEDLEFTLAVAACC